MFIFNNQRIILFKKNFLRLNLDAFLVSNPNNIFYLVGFEGLSEKERESWLLVTKNKVYFFTDKRYFSYSKKFSNGKIIIISPKNTLIKNLKQIIDKEQIRICGVEADDLKINEFNALKIKINSVRFQSIEKLIINQRSIKEKEEIKKIKKACLLTEKCLNEIIKLIKKGITEKEIAFKIEFFLKEKNFELAFPPIIAFDENSSLPHYNTKGGNNKKLKNNGIILIDFGVKFENYCSDITRVFFLEKPDTQIIKIYQKLLEAQNETINFCQTDKLAKVVDLFCRENLKRKLLNFNSYFYSHATGHGIGLEIHENPKISINSEERINNNQIFTIEPGIYIPKKYGLRIEDTILIEDSKPKRLTKFSKEIIIL